jgi:MFS family permease
MTDRASVPVNAGQLVAIVCAAQVLAQVGAYTWPALLPGFIDRWGLDYAEAGWITGIFYASYTLSVPILVTLTDRIDPRGVYLTGVALTVLSHAGFAIYADGFWSAMAFRALAGIGWAGTYMTGLKLLADRVPGKLMSRAVSGHAASVGISGALSFIFADMVADWLGWQGAFAVAAGAAGTGWMLVLLFAPRRKGPGATAGVALFDFRPVFRNRSAMAYAAAYCVHTWEMNALRGWAVAFLAYVAATAGPAPAWLAPAVIATAMALVGTGASVFGNEMSIRFGRQRLVRTAFIGSILLAAIIGFAGPLAYGLAVFLVLLYGAMIWLDSSSLTAGTAASADPARRGATLAVHSMLGYAGGFVGPLAIGICLDLAGGMSQIGWGLAFLQVAVVMLLGRILFTWLRPRDLPGDRGTG